MLKPYARKPLCQSDIDAAIKHGQIAAKRLKRLYPEQHWEEIAVTLSLLKEKLFVFFPEKNEAELLHQAIVYSDSDLKDILGE